LSGPVTGQVVVDPDDPIGLLIQTDTLVSKARMHKLLEKERLLDQGYLLIRDLSSQLNACNISYDSALNQWGEQQKLMESSLITLQQNQQIQLKQTTTIKQTTQRISRRVSWINTWQSIKNPVLVIGSFVGGMLVQSKLK